MVALSSAPFVFVVVCSMFVVTSQKCSTGISIKPGGCLYIQDGRKMENEAWRMDRNSLETQVCDRVWEKNESYNGMLPSFQSIDSQAKLNQILRRRTCDKCSEDEYVANRTHRRHFWIRLIRKWNVGNRREKDQMSDSTKWTWGEGETAMSGDFVYGAGRFPPWADGEPNSEYYGGGSNGDDATCVISRETSDGKYPWFEWIVAPCRLDDETGETGKNLRDALTRNGIVVCEGTKKNRRQPSATTTPGSCKCDTDESTTSSTASAAISSTSHGEITSTSSSKRSSPTTTPGNASATCEPPATTTPARSIVWHPAFISILVSLACMTAFFLACGVYVWFKQRRIRELKARIKKSEYASTTSSGMTSMSTIISIDDSTRRDDDSDEGSKRKRSRSKGKKKGRGKK